MAVENIGAEKLREMLRTRKDKVEVIDVREPGEYQAIHIKGSKLIPMNELLGRLDEIDWTKEVVFICRSGSRSGMMAMLVAAQKGKEVKNLEYGIFECQAGGKGEFLETAPEELEGYF